MIRFFGAALVFFGALAAPAFATWNEASSDHFVIYADEDEKDLRSFSTRLEKYHGAMTAQLGWEDVIPSPSNRVTIYVVRNEKEVRRLFGDGDNRYLGGFYVPRAGGSLAIIPRLEKTSGAVSDSERVLFHEYAHHFMYGSSSFTFPRWLSEGFAEFYSTSRFEADGSVGLGLPATHRAGELGYAVNVPMDQLLDTQNYLAKKSKQYDEFYGKSWGLFHYLRFAPERNGQLVKYLTLLGEGKKEKESAIEAFGNFKQLDKDLTRYLSQRRLSYFKLPGNLMKIGEIKIRPLDTGHVAIMPLLIQSKLGVNEEKAKVLVPEVRSVATQFPANSVVLAALAEAEYDAGNDEAAIAAADKAIAINPQSVNALLQKGYAMGRLAETSGDEKAWSKVRAQFIKVNKIENDHPSPLVRYYMTYMENGDDPPKLAISGLERALELAPFDAGLRMMVATQQIHDGRKESAIQVLKPLAFSPHDSELSKLALQMIETAKGNASAPDAETDDPFDEDAPAENPAG